MTSKQDHKRVQWGRITVLMYNKKETDEIVPVHGLKMRSYHFPFNLISSDEIRGEKDTTQRLVLTQLFVCIQIIGHGVVKHLTYAWF